jgi:hypothetical protein
MDTCEYVCPGNGACARAHTHTHTHTHTRGDRDAGRCDGPPPCERRGGARACGLGPVLSHHRVSTDNVFCEPWFCPVGTARCNQGLASAHQAGGGIGGCKARHVGPWRLGKHHGCWSDLSAHLDCFEYDLRSGPVPDKLSSPPPLGCASLAPSSRYLATASLLFSHPLLWVHKYDVINPRKREDSHMHFGLSAILLI